MCIVKLLTMQKSKKIVLFDIDYTLFDTDSFRVILYEQLAKMLGFTDIQKFYKLTIQAEEETKKELGYYRRDVFLEILKREAKKDVPLEELQEIYRNESLYTSTLYKDSREVVQKLATKGVHMNILSTGYKEFQMMKIASLNEFLPINSLHIFENKILHLKDVLSQYAGYTIYIVDDFRDILKEAKSLNPQVITIWITRQKKFEDNFGSDDFTPDYQVKNLKEIVPLIIKGG